ncbi:hypothetical protein QQ045_016669 [Rhodiola kirilowii]
MLSKSTFLSSILFIILFSSTPISHSLPLSTNGRWIVDAATGHRVKLHCANWAGHIETMVPEGLDKQPLDKITSTVAALGFNCVRLTWAIFMYTRPEEYSNLTLSQAFDIQNLTDAKAQIMKYNPSLVDLKVGDVHEAVINSLGKKSVMVVYDNHISRPTWCCSTKDGNGFFNDRDFSPQEWLTGLSLVATRYKNNPTVVAMSMRNELRGPRENVADWFNYTHQGATTIHAANPNVLVFISGLNFDTHFSFLSNMSYGFPLDNKLLFEFHWYSFSQQHSQRDWGTEPLYQSCATYTQWFDTEAGFIFRNTTNLYPLILTEFGIDERGMDVAANNFLTCFCTIAAGNELDWGLWALQGSYYIRSGVPGPEEDYGVLDNNWSQPRNPAVLQRFKLLQEMLIDPFAKTPTYYIMYHPVTGTCVMADVKDNQVYQVECSQKSGWDHTADETPIALHGNGSCLIATGESLPVTLSNDCKGAMSSWSLLSDSKLHIGVTGPKGVVSLCLEWGVAGNATVLVSKNCDLQSATSQNQWFQLLPTNQ